MHTCVLDLLDQSHPRKIRAGFTSGFWRRGMMLASLKRVFTNRPIAAMYGWSPSRRSPASGVRTSGVWGKNNEQDFIFFTERNFVKKLLSSFHEFRNTTKFKNIVFDLDFKIVNICLRLRRYHLVPCNLQWIREETSSAHVCASTLKGFIILPALLRGHPLQTSSSDPKSCKVFLAAKLQKWSNVRASSTAPLLHATLYTLQVN